MGEIADFRNLRVANRGNPEPFLAPRPGFEPGSRADRKALWG